MVHILNPSSDDNMLHSTDLFWVDTSANLVKISLKKTSKDTQDLVQRITKKLYYHTFPKLLLGVWIFFPFSSVVDLHSWLIYQIMYHTGGPPGWYQSPLNVPLTDIQLSLSEQLIPSCTSGWGYEIGPVCVCVSAPSLGWLEIRFYWKSLPPHMNCCCFLGNNSCGEINFSKKPFFEPP